MRRAVGRVRVRVHSLQPPTVRNAGHTDHDHNPKKPPRRVRVRGVCGPCGRWGGPAAANGLPGASYATWGAFSPLGHAAIRRATRGPTRTRPARAHEGRRRAGRGGGASSCTRSCPWRPRFLGLSPSPAVCGPSAGPERYGVLMKVRSTSPAGEQCGRGSCPGSARGAGVDHRASWAITGAGSGRSGGRRGPVWVRAGPKTNRGRRCVRRPRWGCVGMWKGSDQSKGRLTVGSSMLRRRMLVSMRMFEPQMLRSAWKKRIW